MSFLKDLHCLQQHLASLISWKNHENKGKENLYAGITA
jgi:hypothetical protein